MWQCPVLKLGEGRDDLDTVERDPYPQKGGRHWGLLLSTGETGHPWAQARGIWVSVQLERSGSNKGNYLYYKAGEMKDGDP